MKKVASTIGISRRAVAEAFAQHAKRYDVMGAWKIAYHVDMWRWARRARSSGSLEAFTPIYDELRGPWLAFRPQPRPKTAGQVFAIIRRLPSRLRGVNLTRLASGTPRALREVWGALLTASPIKTNVRSGPSVVAISKFLHFWNPRLFVIVDRQVMRDLVLTHWWLRGDTARVREEIAAKVPDIASHALFAGDLGNYLVALVWAGRLLASHPFVMEEFKAHLERDARKNGCEPPAFAGQLEAAAVEWLLLGLVELPPEGVSVPAEGQANKEGGAADGAAGKKRFAMALEGDLGALLGVAEGDTVDLDGAVGHMRGVFGQDLVARVRAVLGGMQVGEEFPGGSVSPNLPVVWKRVT